MFVLAISNQGQGHLHAGNRPWKAAEGGIHWSVEFSYQVSPNVHTKCVLLSKCNWIAMWLSNMVECLYATSLKCYSDYIFTFIFTLPFFQLMFSTSFDTWLGYTAKSRVK